MVIKRKPRIGLLGIMHGIYDKAQPGITKQQEKYAREVVSYLSDVASIDFPGAAKTRNNIETIIEDFNQKNYDGILIIMLLYCPGLWTVNALKKNKLPVMIANIQPVPSITKDWDWGDLTTNQGIHGSQDIANVMFRNGIKPIVITEEWKTEKFKRFFEDWALVAQASFSLKKSRIVIFGRCPGMGDIVGDDLAFLRILGTEVNHVGIGEVYRYMQSVNNSEIDKQMVENHTNFKVEQDVKIDSHRYAVKLQLGFEKFLIDQDYDGFSAQCTIFKEDGRFKQLPLLGASNLLAKGYGYAGEGDSNTTYLTLVGHLIAENPHFTEMYSLDFHRDSAFMSHMGEGNWKIARKDRPIRLIDRALEIGELENPPTLVFSAESGPATLLSLSHWEGDRYRIICSKGEVLDTDELPNVPMPYFHFKPQSGIRQAMDSWLSCGGTHHQVLVLGDHLRKLKILSEMLNIEYVEV
jgi:L-arabinose isomerase